ncbi:unnamed protein product [Rotaria socialis]
MHALEKSKSSENIKGMCLPSTSCFGKPGIDVHFFTIFIIEKRPGNKTQQLTNCLFLQTKIKGASLWIFIC